MSFGRLGRRRRKGVMQPWDDSLECKAQKISLSFPSVQKTRYLENAYYVGFIHFVLNNFYILLSVFVLLSCWMAVAFLGRDIE